MTRRDANQGTDRATRRVIPDPIRPPTREDEMPDRLEEVARALAAPLIVGAIGLAAAVRQGKWRIPVSAGMVVAGVALFAFAYRALTNPWVQLAIAAGGFVVLTTGAHFLARAQERKAEAKEAAEREGRDRREKEERESRLAREMSERKERFDREEEERKERRTREDAEREERNRRYTKEDEDRRAKWALDEKNHWLRIKVSSWDRPRLLKQIEFLEKELGGEKDPAKIADTKRIIGVLRQLDQESQGKTGKQ
jgi:hypothetical protein